MPLKIFLILFIALSQSLLALDSDKLVNRRHILNTQEIKYIEQKKVLKVCTNPDWIPIEFSKNGVPKGISIDILKIIAAEMRFELKFIKTTSWSQSQQYLKEKKCDILPSAIKTKKRLSYANFTDPYMSYELAVITTKDKPLVASLSSLKHKIMTRKKGSGLIPKIKKAYPTIEILETNTYADSFRLVSQRDAYFTIATLPVFTYYRNSLGLENLHVAGETNMIYKLSMAVRKDDKTLLNILQKTIKKIVPNIFHIVYEKWTKRKVIIKQDYTLAKYISLAFVVILSIILYFLIKQKKLKNEVIRLNKTLEKRVLDAVEKNREKDKAMLQQSRFAQMGEMINMIAHQWRQPLGAISATSSTMHIKAKLNKLDNQQVLALTNKISELSQHLSKTIDDFRNFFKADKEIKEVRCEDLIRSTLSIIEMSIKSHDIILIVDINCNETIKVYDNEVKQVILNLIKNAEDVLLDRKIKDPTITITAHNKTIYIKDNAGGIPPKIIDKIFDPYFSTKKKKDGTGLGL
ncbi:MAG: transporter substrate-binding domain-containing protein, partial [Epsilonproteobacteria bacterium]|nr:transporter substrate-binding domain-containing protein [Campylobacterota bacterium]